MWDYVETAWKLYFMLLLESVIDHLFSDNWSKPCKPIGPIAAQWKIRFVMLATYLHM